MEFHQSFNAHKIVCCNFAMNFDGFPLMLLAMNIMEHCKITIMSRGIVMQILFVARLLLLLALFGFHLHLLMVHGVSRRMLTIVQLEYIETS